VLVESEGDRTNVELFGTLAVNTGAVPPPEYVISDKFFLHAARKTRARAGKSILFIYFIFRKV